MSVVSRLLQEYGEVSDQGSATLGASPVGFKDGYIICPWLMTWRVQPAEEFAKRQRQETGWVLCDASRREIVRIEQMARW